MFAVVVPQHHVRLTVNSKSTLNECILRWEYMPKVWDSHYFMGCGLSRRPEPTLSGRLLLPGCTVPSPGNTNTVGVNKREPLNLDIVTLLSPKERIENRKVYTDLEEITTEKPRLWESGDDLNESPDLSHRGRAKVDALRRALRTEVLARKDQKGFWNFVRNDTDPRTRKAKVSLTELSAVFERLDFPATMPESCNSYGVAFNSHMARELATAVAFKFDSGVLYTREIRDREK
ncbi:hypothetical protein R3P38DRAFT_3201499 [Favolaschia claudopus]|uniref:Uncharacterized protein n=1 Tax=Favolaschia claudopus TaxID=2862362 RepID=A0AAW0AWI8_9AGAR